MKSKYYETLFKKGDRTTTDFNIMAMFIISLISLFALTLLFLGLKNPNVGKYHVVYDIIIYLLGSYYLFYIAIICLSLRFNIKFFARIFYTHEKIVGIFTYVLFILFAHLLSLPFFIMHNTTESIIYIYILIFFLVSLIGIICFLFVAYKMKSNKLINYFTSPSPQVVSPGLILLFSNYFITRNLDITIVTITSILICFASAEYLVAVIVKWRNPEYLEFPTKKAVEDALREGVTSSSSVKKEKFGFWKRKAVWVFCLTAGLFYGAAKLVEMTTNETYQKICSAVGLISLFTACMSLLVLIVQYILYRKTRGKKRR